jgi:hypothetical protein
MAGVGLAIPAIILTWWFGPALVALVAMCAAAVVCVAVRHPVVATWVALVALAIGMWTLRLLPL